ncbi:hypothetical protein HS1genome_0535 [Sulfodiicoccus acidiphilus]|uniref:DUF2848 domain-containing protein n=1 Tax=Sulfodiicoccus acidiphilus TaxID=1670455 RepID=A0A348B1U4_9CREN|nr:DUF2848 family protein [Sulfodiicoccus acidiphilus]BBD72146.1 hypothetical protein HS1genome_0535 [Sulfodiicoccus acidiphilus]GGT94657.1 hypothetical protein GCM10007116_10320 [Sulfodiicoccus acidiphilus]
MGKIWFNVIRRNGIVEGRLFDIGKVVCAGYAGRNREAVMRHVRELQEIGVPPPPSVPTKYVVPTTNLTTATKVNVRSSTTSGEVEYVLIIDDEWYVGVGSDHTDRELEKVDVERAKSSCPKVVSTSLWPYGDIRDHWDELELTSKVGMRGTTVEYQRGKLRELLTPEELVSSLGEGERGTCIFSGTIPLLGNTLFAESFNMKLSDPVLRRELSHVYEVRVTH